MPKFTKEDFKMICESHGLNVIKDGMFDSYGHFKEAILAKISGVNECIASYCDSDGLIRFWAELKHEENGRICTYPSRNEIVEINTHNNLLTRDGIIDEIHKNFIRANENYKVLRKKIRKQMIEEL